MCPLQPLSFLLLSTFIFQSFLSSLTLSRWINCMNFFSKWAPHFICVFENCQAFFFFGEKATEKCEHSSWHPHFDLFRFIVNNTAHTYTHTDVWEIHVCTRTIYKRNEWWKKHAFKIIFISFSFFPWTSLPFFC